MPLSYYHLRKYWLCPCGLCFSACRPQGIRLKALETALLGAAPTQGLMGGSWRVSVPAPSPLGGITVVHTLHGLPLVPLVLNPVTPSRTCS